MEEPHFALVRALDDVVEDHASRLSPAAKLVMAIAGKEIENLRTEVAHLTVVLANVRDGAAELRRKLDVAEKDRYALRGELAQEMEEVRMLRERLVMEG